jgi:hypothetical protein
LFLTGGAGTGKTFTLQLIVQGLLRFYHSDLQSDPLKPKVLLMAFTGKATFNIDGCTIHSALRIPINQSLSNMGKLSSELLNKLTDDYEQIKLIVIDEISLVGARMLDAIDQRLRSIKHFKNKYFLGVYVIVCGDFYQAPPVRDKWVFQKLDDGLNSLAPNFWNDCIKCYELITVMRQNDPHFIDILNRFRKGTHNITDIHTMNNLCFKQPPNNFTIPHLYYMNKDTLAHNLKVFDNTEGLTYYLNAVDIKHQSLSANFKIPNDPSKTAGLHTLIKVKRNMLVELCAGNYATHDGLVNGADGLLKTFILINSKTYIFIEFLNPKIGSLTRLANAHLYKDKNICRTWTPIEPQTKEI